MKFNMIFVMEILAAAVATEILYKLFIKRRDGKKRKSIRSIHDVIIFNDLPIKTCDRFRSKLNPALERMTCYLKSARRSVDVCMFVFTNKILSTLLVVLARRGVAVRIILDRDMAVSSGSQTMPLLEHGIPVRYKKSPHIMHHKFCLIDAWDDGSGILMTGSLNWTSNAIYNNWENVIVTSQHELVLGYRDEFQRLWEEFGDVQRELAAAAVEVNVSA